MAKPTKETETPTPEAPATPSTALTPHKTTDFNALFARSVNSRSPVKSLSVKSVLTKPLVAMAHMKLFVFECTSEMYAMPLPQKGRKGGKGLVRVVDGIDITPDEDGRSSGQECTLIFNEVMVSSVARLGCQSINVTIDENDENIVSTLAGKSLVGRAFAFKRGDINEDKGYRYVEVAELEVER